MRFQAQQRFDAVPEAVRDARSFLQAAFAGRVAPEVQSDMTLVVSELASNAVRHAQTSFAVNVAVNGHIRIEVEDGSPDPPAPRTPSSEGGRGLLIIDVLCDRWGTDVRHEAKCVWCERDLPAEAAEERTS